MVGLGQARRLLSLDDRMLGVVATKPGDHPGQDQDQPVPAGVDDAGLAQHVELLGRALDGALTVLDRLFEHPGEDRVLLLATGLAPQPLLA